MSLTNPAAVEDDPKRPYKAYVSAALSAVAAFLVYWIADPGDFTREDVLQALVSAIVASGLIGGGTFGTGNPKRLKTPSTHA